jgi:hypothetical protein
MGTCVQKSSPRPHKPEVVKRNNIDQTRTHTVRETMNIVEIEDERFREFPEWDGKINLTKGDRFTGLGIRRMKAYISTMNVKDLEILRNEFWCI